ncbi:MAG: hypothetical protein JSW61_02190, partial [Candidatus Thorarchaeota archaeon]
GYVSTHTYSNTEYESLESQYPTYYGDLFESSGELSPCGEWPPSKSPIGHPSDVPMVFVAYPPGFEEYATAILKICETGFLKYVEVFGLSTADIHIFIRTNQESLFACYSHEYRIFNYLRSIDDCRPPPNGAHHVYGFLHEMGHMVFSTDNGAFNQGWAHYAASRIVDEVYRELGDTAWPRPYNYSKTEGKQRLLADIARTQPGTYDAASGVLYTIDQRHGPTIFKATIDKMHPTYIGVYRYPLYSLEEFKSTLVELTNDESLLELFSENGF